MKYIEIFIEWFFTAFLSTLHHCLGVCVLRCCIILSADFCKAGIRTGAVRKHLVPDLPVNYSWIRFLGHSSHVFLFSLSNSLCSDGLQHLHRDLFFQLYLYLERAGKIHSTAKLKVIRIKLLPLLVSCTLRITQNLRKFENSWLHFKILLAHVNSPHQSVFYHTHLEVAQLSHHTCATSFILVFILYSEQHPHWRSNFLHWWAKDFSIIIIIKNKIKTVSCSSDGNRKTVGTACVIH